MEKRENKLSEKEKAPLAMKPENENNFRKVGVPLIKVVDSMEKLRKLDMLELPWLADDIRSEIIKVVSKNGLGKFTPAKKSKKCQRCFILHGPYQAARPRNCRS